MITMNQTKQLLNGGGNVVDADGKKIGSIGQVFADHQTGRPEWVTVTTGRFGGGQSFVPLRDADAAGGDLRVPYSEEKVQGAPRISDSDAHLSEEEEGTLYAYYGESGAEYDTSYGVVDSDAREHEEHYDAVHGGSVTNGEARGGGEQYDAVHGGSDSAALGSEEQRQVGAWTYETGRTRLRRYVVTGEATSTGGKPIPERH